MLISAVTVVWATVVSPADHTDQLSAGSLEGRCYLAVDALAYASDGRIKPYEGPKPPEELVKGLTEAEKNCFDPTSGALLSAVPRGLVLAPLFYGPTVLKLSPHDVVAGPYHRNIPGNLANLDILMGKPDESRRVISRYGVQ